MIHIVGNIVICNNMINRNIYKRPDIADNYSSKLHKRKGLCLFDMNYIQKNILKNTKVLDLGCGTGRHLVSFGNATNITGIDISPKMIEIANKALKKNNIKVKTIVGDMLEIDSLIKNEIFDTAIMMYHTFGSIVPARNRILLLNKIKKLLKKDGLLLLHVHNRNHIKNLKFLFNDYFNNKFETGDKLIRSGELKGAVIHFFSEREIKKILNSVGFEIVEFINMDFPNEEKQIKGFKKYFYSGGFIIKAQKNNKL